MSEGGSTTPVVLAACLVVALLGAVLVSVGGYLAAHGRAATAADAAALAAAPVTFAPFGASGSPAEEAAALAAANGFRLVRCRCALDSSWAPRTVEVEVEGTAGFPLVGTRVVRATSRAEFVPARLLVADPAGLLADRRLVLAPAARRDLEAGRLDPRLVTVLSLMVERHSVAVSVFATGHAKYVRGTDRISHHHFGRAADIWLVDGERVSGRSGPARRLVGWLADLPGPLRPDEVGSPFREFTHLPGFFTDADHQGHLHVAYGP